MIRSIQSPNLQDGLADSAEVLFDLALENEALKSIPVFGLLLKTARGTLEIRDYIFLRKVRSFLLELQNIPVEDREAFVQEIEFEPGKAARAGVALLEIIDKAQGDTKARYIGRLFGHAVRQKITFEECLRLTHVVNILYVDDLRALLGLASDKVDFNRAGQLFESLVGAGLVTIIDPGMAWTEGAMTGTLNQLARVLRELLGRPDDDP